MIGIQKNLAGYAEEFFRPVAKVKINGAEKIVIPPKPRLLPHICSRVETFFCEWTQHSYEAWVKNQTISRKIGKQNDFTCISQVIG